MELQMKKITLNRVDGNYHQQDNSIVYIHLSNGIDVTLYSSKCGNYTSVDVKSHNQGLVPAINLNETGKELFENFSTQSIGLNAEGIDSIRVSVSLSSFQTKTKTEAEAEAEAVIEEKFARKCDHCGKGMNEGYCWGDGEGYACSDKCLYSDGYTESELNADINLGVIYWTEWEELDDESYYTASGTEVYTG
jgi:hypothetical protein